MRILGVIFNFYYMVVGFGYYKERVMGLLDV